MIPYASQKKIAETHRTSEGEILVPLNSECYLAFTSAETRTEFRWSREIFSSHSVTRAVASQTVHPTYVVVVCLATATREETFKTENVTMR